MPHQLPGLARVLIALALTTLALPAAGGSAPAQELAVTYFSVAEWGDPDFHTTGCCVFTSRLVQAGLGPSGLPLLNPAYGSGGHAGYVVHDVNEAGEITWWTPRPTVTPTGSGFVTMPIRNSRFFPPNGTGRSNAEAFQTAVFKGVLHVPEAEAVHFRVGADDAAFVYLDGRLLADLSGVHPRIGRPVVTKLLQPGDYCLALFYADLYPDHAELFFSIETGDVTVSPPTEAGNQAPISPTGCEVPVS